MILPKNDEDLLKFLLYLHDRSDDYLWTYHRDWRSYYKLYNSYVNEDTYPLRNKVFLPWTFSIIETILPRFTAGMLYRKPMMQVLPGHPDTLLTGARACAQLLNNTPRGWMVDRQTWQSLLMMVKEMLMCGTSFCKQYWSQIRRNQNQYRRVELGSAQPFFVKAPNKSILIENRPRIDHVDVYDVVPDLEHGQDPQWMCHHIVKSMDEWEFGSSIKYRQMDKVRSEPPSRYTYDEDPRYLRLSAIEHNQPGWEWIVDNPREAYEYTIKEFTPEGEKIWVITVHSRKYITRKEQINYWPWHTLRNYAMPHEMLGISEIQSISRVQHAHNFHFNLMLEGMVMSLMKMWLVGSSANADMRQFKLQPFGVIQVDDIDQVKDIRFDAISGDAFNMSHMLENVYNVATGINDYARGGNAPRKEYATSILALQTASEARIDGRIKQDENGWLSPIGQMFIELAQDELDEPEHILVDKDSNTWETILMDQIQGQMDIQVSASAGGMNEIARQQLVEFSQTAAQLIGPQAPMQMRVEMLRGIAATFNNENIMQVMDNLDKFAAAQEQQAQLQAQQQQQQQGSPNGAGGTPGPGAGPPQPAAGIPQIPGVGGKSGVGPLASAVAQAQAAPNS